MKNFLGNLFNGIFKRIKKSLHRPYSVFNISWLKEKILKHSDNRTITSHTYNGKYKINFSDRSAFLLSVKELFIDEIYKFQTENESPYIIDCGSHIGMSLLYFSVNYKNSTIVGFEPDSFNYNIAKDNIHQCSLNNVEIINAAVWIENGNVDFLSSGDMSSSIKLNEAKKNDNTEKTKCIRLRDFLEKKVDFLKIDIEGAEYEVLLDCSDRLSNVDNLFIEYHGNFNEMNKLTDILHLLVQQNFSFYIKEAGDIYSKPFWNHEKTVYNFDVQLNIFCFKNKKY
jgi:FkbM family methyltransferase